MATLSVIVPATDAPPTLPRCLDAIAQADDPPDEVIVIDSPSGSGPAAARNSGVERACGEIVVFVDADVLVHADAFSRIRASFRSDPGLAAVFGSYDDSPPAGGAVSKFRNLLHHDVHQASAGPAATFWAGLGAVRREAFRAAGGFDAERYPRPAIEDIELGVRLAAAGERIELDPRIQGTHLKRWTLRLMLRTDLLDRGIPWVALLTRRRAGSNVLNLGWRQRAASVAAVVAVGALGARRPRTAVTAASVFVAINRSFYAMLARRCGPRTALAGVPLHMLHHLTGVLAVPPGIVAGILQGRSCSQDARPQPD